MGMMALRGLNETVREHSLYVYDTFEHMHWRYQHNKYHFHGALISNLQAFAIDCLIDLQSQQLELGRLWTKLTRVRLGSC